MLIPLLCALLLSACSVRQVDLSGQYEAGTDYGKMVYDFSDDKNVTCSYESMSNVLFTQTGKYDISEDGNMISFTVSQDDDGFSNVPAGFNAFAGTYTFREAEDGILIGNIYYQKRRGNEL